VGALFGLMAALTITSGDFFSRRVTNEIGPIVTASATSLVATMTALVFAIATDGSLLAGDMLLGALSGIGFGVGISTYLHGVFISSSAVVAPVNASLATLIPFTYASITGGAPPIVGILGAGAAVLGLIFVTVGGAEASNVRGGFPVAAVSGLGYGIGTVFMINLDEASGNWPLVSQRGVAVLVVVAYALARRRPLLPPKRFAPNVIAGGTFAGLSSILLLAGLALNAPAASVTVSLFPAAAVVSGRLFFGDSVSRFQVMGLLIVVAGTVGIVLA
jgi:drug/metabolite transporter (DMT)-like permease